MLVKFECGCIGFQPQGGVSLIVRPCDDEPYGNTEEYRIFHRDMGGKPWTEITNLHALNKIAMDLKDLVHDGYAFRELKRILES